jgi:hypothetical protein
MYRILSRPAHAPKQKTPTKMATTEITLAATRLLLKVERRTKRAVSNSVQQFILPGIS